MHRGERPAETAEELMRSRYSAFAREDEAYLLRSWHPATRPGGVPFDGRTRWTGLEIIAAEAGGPADAKGTVEFRARYRDEAGPGELHEVSRFVRHDGAWVYVRGRTG